MMQYFKSLGAQGLARRVVVLSMVAIGIVVLSPMASASVLTQAACANTTLGQTTQPCLYNGPAGTLLASLSVPFTASTGKTSGTLLSAVYRETGTNTLDFYYQVFTNTTAGALTGTGGCGHGGGQATCDPLSRETDTDFSTWDTQLAFRTNGATLGGGFANGDVAPQTADRNLAPGDVIGFGFNAGAFPAPIQPGQSSNVLIISTNAFNFTNGNASVIDGGVTTVASFQPSAAVPEPASFALLGLGLVALGGLSRRIKNRRV